MRIVEYLIWRTWSHQRAGQIPISRECTQGDQVMRGGYSHQAHGSSTFYPYICLYKLTVPWLNEDAAHYNFCVSPETRFHTFDKLDFINSNLSPQRCFCFLCFHIRGIKESIIAKAFIIIYHGYLLLKF